MTTVLAQLPNGAEVAVELRQQGGLQDAAAVGRFDLDGVRDTIAGLAQLAQSAVDSVRPQEFVAEFGLDVKVEAGKLTGLLVSGSGEASLKITLKWGGGGG